MICVTPPPTFPCSLPLLQSLSTLSYHLHHTKSTACVTPPLLPVSPPPYHRLRHSSFTPCVTTHLPTALTCRLRSASVSHLLPTSLLLYGLSSPSCRTHCSSTLTYSLLSPASTH